MVGLAKPLHIIIDQSAQPFIMVFCWLDQAITYYYRSVSPAIHDDDIAVDLAKLLTDWSAQPLNS
jgi:hypothetical protein